MQSCKRIMITLLAYTMYIIKHHFHYFLDIIRMYMPISVETNVHLVIKFEILWREACSLFNIWRYHYKLLIFLNFLSNPTSHNRGKSHCGWKPNWRCSFMCGICQSKGTNLFASLISWDSNLKINTQFINPKQLFCFQLNCNLH